MKKSEIIILSLFVAVIAFFAFRHFNFSFALVGAGLNPGDVEVIA